MAASPTQRSLKHLRAAGCIAQVVEKWNAHAKVRVDLFGIIDVVALSPEGETIGVQACAMSSVSKRVDKITESESLAMLRKCGWRLLVHGWGKQPNGRYRLREVDLS
jgi:hypothetical protein